MQADLPTDEARVLVVVLPDRADLQRARNLGWYRIPLRHAPRQLAADYLAFYQTAAFGPERWSVRSYAPVRRYQVLPRWRLLPAEPDHPRAHERYYCITLGTLRPLPVPIPAARLRRVTFIATTFGHLRRAQDVRDLWQRAADIPPPAVWGAGLAGRCLHEPAAAPLDTADDVLYYQ